MQLCKIYITFKATGREWRLIKKVRVANAVRQARSSAHLTQVDLASACQVTRQTIGLIEAGQYNPTVKLALLIGRALGRELNDLFRLEEENE